jgi:hypothetical protein
MRRAERAGRLVLASLLDSPLEEAESEPSVPESRKRAPPLVREHVANRFPVLGAGRGMISAPVLDPARCDANRDRVCCEVVASVLRCFPAILP